MRVEYKPRKDGSAFKRVDVIVTTDEHYATVHVGFIERSHGQVQCFDVFGEVVGKPCTMIEAPLKLWDRYKEMGKVQG